MAFDILSSLLRIVPSLISDFSGEDAPESERYANRLMGQRQGLGDEIANLSRAQLDPRNPTYQALYKQERQSGQQDLARVIAEAQAQNRMATRLGRTPLFDANRGGETIFRSLMQQYGGVQDQARQRARGIMTGAQTGLGNASSIYSGLINDAMSMGRTEADREARNRSSMLSGFGGIADILQSRTQRQYLPGGSYIDWNGPRYS